jgi:excisionase family DNA binding protein
MILDAETEDLARQIADHLLPALRELQGSAESASGWLTTKDAASYLGISGNALYKLTGSGELTFTQDAPRGKMFFQRADLDDYRLKSMQMLR